MAGKPAKEAKPAAKPVAKPAEKPAEKPKGKQCVLYLAKMLAEVPIFLKNYQILPKHLGETTMATKPDAKPKAKPEAKPKDKPKA